MLAGLNTSLSYYGGSLLGWAIIGPLLVAKGQARGIAQPNGDGLPYINYFSMVADDLSSKDASPRYNLLWPGVAIMLVASFAELLCHWRLFVDGLRSAIATEPAPGEEAKLDPAASEVPWWVWTSSLLAAVALTLYGLRSFGVSAGLSLLAIILGFALSLVGVLSMGQAGLNVTTACAKGTQLVFGGLTRGQPGALSLNLLAGTIASGAAQQATDMISDLKVAQLHGASPLVQFIGQGIGSFCACFASLAIFVLFARASPCILDGSDYCSFPAPSAVAWKAVAIASTADKLPVPYVSAMLTIAFSILATLVVVVRESVISPRWRPYVPNLIAVGSAFVTPQMYLGLAMCMGAVLAQHWRRRDAKHYESCGVAVAAGMAAGEGIGGVAVAALSIFGLAKPLTKFGCPRVRRLGSCLTSQGIC